MLARNSRSRGKHPGWEYAKRWIAFWHRYLHGELQRRDLQDEVRCAEVEKTSTSYETRKGEHSGRCTTLPRDMVLPMAIEAFQLLDLLDMDH